MSPASPKRGRLTAADLRLLRTTSSPHNDSFYSVRRRQVPTIGETGPQAELVTWKMSTWRVMGVLLDPALESVPIQASAPFRWLCRYRLFRERRKACVWGRKMGLEVWANE